MTLFSRTKNDFEYFEIKLLLPVIKKINEESEFVENYRGFELEFNTTLQFVKRENYRYLCLCLFGFGITIRSQ